MMLERMCAVPAGAVGAAVWAAQQPLDKRVFGCDYDDVELLGKPVTRGANGPPSDGHPSGERRGLRRRLRACARSCPGRPSCAR